MNAESLTITLTSRRPVTVNKADWPIIAKGKTWDNKYEHQANRTYSLFVRQHQDGRAIVYGVYTTCYEGERDRRGGELLAPDADIPAAIRRVADELDFDSEIAQLCIADLPAEQI
jgi:hypothetical protein